MVIGTTKPIAITENKTKKRLMQTSCCFFFFFFGNSFLVGAAPPGGGPGGAPGGGPWGECLPMWLDLHVSQRCSRGTSPVCMVGGQSLKGLIGNVCATSPVHVVGGQGLKGLSGNCYGICMSRKGVPGSPLLSVWLEARASRDSSGRYVQPLLSIW